MRIENTEEVMKQLKAQLPAYVKHMTGEEPGKTKFLCPSPDHDDHTPSACLNHHEDFTEGKCFTCGANFDIFTLAHWNEGLPAEGPDFFNVTVRELAERFGITLVESELSEKEKALYGAYRAIRLAAEYVANLETTIWPEEVLAYIEERNWTKQAISNLGVGVGDREGLIEFMTSRGYSVEYLHKVGLVSLGNGDGIPQVIADGRLIFTIFDHNSRPVGFASRGFDNSAKYLNSASLIQFDIYNKSELVYGLNWARKYKKSPLYLFEGYGDVITAQLNGIPNCAAVCGTSLTIDQLLLIQSIGFQTINLTFDFDEAGKKATDRAVEYVCKDVRQLAIKVVNPDLVEKSDPDSYIREHGAEEFLAIPRETTFSWMLRRKMEGDFDGHALANTMVEVIASEPNAISRELQTRELSVATGVGIHSIEVEVNKRTDESLQERRSQQNAILKRLSIDVDNDPASVMTSVNLAIQSLEKISKESDMDSVTNHAFLSLIDIQCEEEREREENNTPVGFGLPLLREFQEDLSGGDDWADQNL